MIFRLKTKEEFYNAVQKIKDAGYRCIVKPADNSGSRGIDLLDNFEQETLDRAYEYSKQSSRSGDLMVEEFMEGAEVSVETLSINGECHVIQITDKMTTGAPYLSLIHISEPTRRSYISFAVFCLKKFFFNDTATTEIYTRLFVGSVRCV